MLMKFLKPSESLESFLAIGSISYLPAIDQIKRMKLYIKVIAWSFIYSLFQLYKPVSSINDESPRHTKRFQYMNSLKMNNLIFWVE